MDPESREPGGHGLIPSSNREIAVVSSGLARRGLDLLTGREPRQVRFPADRSVGRYSLLHMGTWHEVQGTVWSPARGAVAVPPFYELSLMIEDEHAADLSPLSALKPDDVQRLHILSDEVTDAALVHLRRLTGLISLDVSATGVTDAGLIHIQELFNLRELSLTAPLVTDSGVARLMGLTRLKELRLRDTKVSDAGLVNLGALFRLEILEIVNELVDEVEPGVYTDPSPVQVTDAGLAHLRGLTKLRDLSLRWALITDAGLANLRGLSRLRSIDLQATQVTKAGFELLKNDLPNCEIYT